MQTIHPAEIPVFARLPFEPVRGEGCRLYDALGHEYLDLYGGHAVTLSGHAHPRVVAALREQAERLVFYSNALPLAAREGLFTRLARLAPEGLGHAFLVNSGAEANDVALALARRQSGRADVVAVEGGFHGRTLATLAASGLDKYRRLVETNAAGRALAAHTRVVPRDDVGALEAAIDDDVAALIVEPVQGLGGAFDLAPEFLARARELTRERGSLLIFDEVQSGCGRTGAFSAAQLYDVTPDLLTLAKGIASGLPLGAVLASEAAIEGVGVGDLGSTFGGGPVACAAANASLDVLVEERLDQNVRAREAQLREGLAGAPGVVRVQGRGLLLGIVLERESASIRRALFEHERILVGSASQPEIVRLLPPLVVSEEELARFLDRFRARLAA